MMMMSTVEFKLERSKSTLPSTVTTQRTWTGSIHELDWTGLGQQKWTHVQLRSDHHWPCPVSDSVKPNPEGPFTTSKVIGPPCLPEAAPTRGGRDA